MNGIQSSPTNGYTLSEKIENEPPSLLSLPLEIQLKIFSYVGSRDLYSLSLVSREVHIIATEEKIDRINTRGGKLFSLFPLPKTGEVFLARHGERISTLKLSKYDTKAMKKDPQLFSRIISLSPNLHSLEIDGIKINGERCDAIANNALQLNTLRITDSAITAETVATLGKKLTNVVRFSHYTPCIKKGVATAIIDAFRGLEELSLKWCKVKRSEVAKLVERNENLGKLALTSETHGPERLDDAAARTIAQGLPRLEELDLGGNAITHLGASSLARHLTQLKVLKLSNNPIGDEGAIAIAEGLPQLVEIDLHCANIGAKGVQAMATKLHNIVHADLMWNRIGNEGASAVAEGWPLLQVLNLTGTKMGSVGVAAVAAKLTKLRELHISWCPIGDEGAIAIASHQKRLRHLHADHCNIGYSGAKALLTELTPPKFLSMANNSFDLTAIEYKYLRSSYHPHVRIRDHFSLGLLANIQV